MNSMIPDVTSKLFRKRLSMDNSRSYIYIYTVFALPLQYSTKGIGYYDYNVVLKRLPINLNASSHEVSTS